MALVQERDSYLFRFQEGAGLSNRLTAVGWENNKAGYRFDGRTRVDWGGPYLFQYTISGLGMIRVGERQYRLEAGSAFFIKFHGDYCYYMPDESDHYECMFISFHGEEAAKCWSHFTGEHGPVFYLPEYSIPIRTLKSIHQEAKLKKITDVYRASMLAYQFIMELYRFSKGYGVLKKWPALVSEAARLMQEKYDQIDGLEGVASQIGVTKSHLIKLFHRTVGKTPIEYLTKVRMEKAVELLRSEDLSLDEIAQQVGYADVNYFIKVFRKFFGIPPGKFRKNHSTDHILFD